MQSPNNILTTAVLHFYQLLHENSAHPSQEHHLALYLLTGQPIPSQLVATASLSRCDVQPPFLLHSTDIPRRNCSQVHCCTESFGVKRDTLSSLRTTGPKFESRHALQFDGPTASHVLLGADSSTAAVRASVSTLYGQYLCTNSAHRHHGEDASSGAHGQCA